MCGICGIISPKPYSIDAERLISMRDTMRHRGPDGEGLYIDDDRHLGLGHRRLSIIDLSDAGLQPMTSEDRSTWIVFNGEIYNYRELRAQLIPLGYRFQSDSDTEVLLYAYQEWGYDCLQHMIGMFAFTIWDVDNRKFFFARDHLGIKPLYYSFGQDELLFASEMKAIVYADPTCRQPNYDSIYHFLTFTRFDHDETTFFEPIRQLRPGHYMVVSLDDWREPEQHRYWAPSTLGHQAEQTDEEWIQGFYELFEDSIKLQMRSDVPVGAFLSGGLDSSSIVSLAHREISDPINTFSTVYHQKGYDESKFIDTVVDSYPVKHKQTTPDSKKLVQCWERLIWHQETPPTGPGPFSEWSVSELAKESVTVLLSGQGPDEMLGGYFPMFEPYLVTKRHKLVSSPTFAYADGLIRDVKSISALTGKSIPYYLLTMTLPNWDNSLKRAKQYWRAQTYTNEFRQRGNKLTVAESLNPTAGETLFDQHLTNQVLGSQLSQLLHYTDRNTMAFSLEARVPFLDHRFIDYSASMPYRLKINGMETKYVLRQAMKPHLPSEISERKDKKGFPTPLAHWLRNEEEYVREVLTEETLQKRQIMKPNSVLNMVNKHMQNRNDFAWDIWRQVSLELWFQQYID